VRPAVRATSTGSGQRSHTETPRRRTSARVAASMQRNVASRRAGVQDGAMAMAGPRLLIRDAAVVATQDDAGQEIHDASVLVRAGVVEAVGLASELPRTADEVVDARGHLVLPGLVNTHHHVGLTPVQLGTQDLPLELWLTAQLQAKKPDARLDTLFSAFELIGSGVTAVQHLDIMLPPPVSAWPARAEAVIGAYSEIGMRVSYALCLRDQNRLVYADDDAFIATLPAELGAEVAAFLGRTHYRLEDFEMEFLQPVLARSAGIPLARLWLAPINLERCSDRLLTLCREWSTRYGIGIHLHLSETAYQKAYADVMKRTSTEHAPWYVVPADRKWYRNWAVGRLLLEHLRELDPRYPEAGFDVARCRERLLKET
jgi:cytosine/adenosine deaminase-related metal-dependent hydrolase